MPTRCAEEPADLAVKTLAAGARQPRLHRFERRVSSFHGNSQNPVAHVLNAVRICNPRSGHRRAGAIRQRKATFDRSEEHTSELQSLMSTSYAFFCWKIKKITLTSI